MSDALADLTAERDLLALEIETANLRAIRGQMHAAGRMALSESWDDLPNVVDPREWQTDDHGRYIGFSGGLGAQIQDRQDGKNRPYYETEQGLMMIRAQARGLATVNGTGVSIVEKLTDYVIGDGYVFKFDPAEEALKPLAQACQEIIDRFCEDNDWQGDADREIFSRLRVDGEFFVSLHAGGDGSTQIRFIEPEQIKEPDNAASIDDYYNPTGNPCSWSFGIHTLADDVQRVLGYHVQWSDRPNDFDYFPAAIVEHGKVNVVRNIKRGLSDFFPVLRRLNQADKLLRNTEEGAAIQAAIAYIVEAAANVTLPAAQSAQISRADYTTNIRTQGGNTRTQYTKAISPGTVLTTPSGQKYHPGPMGSERGGDFMEVLQGSLRWIGNRWSMPEFLISGDASNANYASTMVAESPFVKSCKAKQTVMKRKFANIMWRVLGNAIKAGALEAFGFWKMDATAVEQLKRVVFLNIEAPQVEVRDLEKETARREKLHNAKVLSLKTWTAQEGEDFETEQDQIAEEPQPMAVDPLTGLPIPGQDRPPREPGKPAPPAPSLQPVDKPKKPGEATPESLRRFAADLLWEGYA